jgi:hypothetical protein
VQGGGKARSMFSTVSMLWRCYCFGILPAKHARNKYLQMRFFEKSLQILRLKMFRREDRAWETEV